MPLQVQPATAADVPRMVEIERDAYASSVFTRYLFPGPMPAGAAAGRAAELAEQMRSDPTTRWTKVVDTDLLGGGDGDGEDQDGVAETTRQKAIVAMAKYHIYKEAADSPAGRTFGPGCNVEACEALFGGLARMRERTMAGKACVYLHLLQTDPAHQRRGAGGLLIQDMLQDARELCLPVWLESSAAAHSVYRKHGFVDVEAHTVDFAPWGLDQVHETWAMVCQEP